ncbi:MAG TPA: YcgL domain-containing protein [Pseudomonadales bacterium]|nr:YcgL domain-containing protein [Pseudomonadales bacterium]
MQKLVICSIYRSPKRDEMYLYVAKQDQLSRVPEELLTLFGTPTHVMDMPLTEKRQLARVETAKVLAALEENGYFLQMPPPQDDYLIKAKPGQFG